MGCGASKVADNAVVNTIPPTTQKAHDTANAPANNSGSSTVPPQQGALKIPQPSESLQNTLSQQLIFPLSTLKADVLISFADSDENLATRLKASLEKEGVTVATVADGANDDLKMSTIRDAAVVVPCMTPAYDKSEHCEMELNFANLIRKPLVPVRFDVGPFTWSSVATAKMLYIDFHDHTNEDWDERVYELIRAVNEQIVKHRDLEAKRAQGGKSGETLEDWLNPDTQRMEIEMAELLKRKMNGTREWVTEEVTKFLGDKDRSVFWLRGVDGAGKSVIAANLWRWLHEKDIIGAYYFFRRNLLRQIGPNVLIRNIAFQLSKRFPSIAAKLQEIKGDFPDVCDTFVNLEHIFRALIEDRLENVPKEEQRKTVILIDGLDDCGHFHSKERLELLDLLSRWADVLPHFVKLIFTSKPQADIDEFFTGFNAYNLDVASENHEADLVLYAFEMIHKIKVQLGMQANTEEEITHVAIKLVTACGGLFSTLFTACEHIRRSHDPKHVLEELTKNVHDERPPTAEPAVSVPVTIEQPDAEQSADQKAA